ncbi:hypothetical protein Tco_0031359 [Tanacetum coccineum]
MHMTKNMGPRTGLNCSIHVQVRVHTAAVLAGLMKGKDGELSKDFCERAYSAATKLQKRRKHKLVSSIYMIKRNGGPSIASMHGRILALAACVLLVPYDMPRYWRIHRLHHRILLIISYIDIGTGDQMKGSQSVPIDGHEVGPVNNEDTLMKVAASWPLSIAIHARELNGSMYLLLKKDIKQMG